MSQHLTKIVVLGPVSPYRGGIAHHTTMFANALAEIADVSVISFVRLYPGWLYPGRFQKEESLLKLVRPAAFLLDTLNPLTWRKAVGQIVAHPPDFVLIPWWTFFLAPCMKYVAQHLNRRGIPVVFFCHNVVDHEAAAWKVLLARAVLRHGAGFVVQTREEEGRLRNLLGDIKVLYHPHPVYDQLPLARGRLPRRASLELLFYGFIRPYKGLDILLAAMSGLSDIDVCLTIVGEPWGRQENEWRRRIREAGLESRVEFVPRYVSDEEGAEYFARADVLVMPYRSATGTGVVAAAYHYRKPVIASAVGGLSEVVEDGKTGLLVRSCDPGALQEAIRKFSETGIANVAANIDIVVEKMTWRHLSDRLLENVAGMAHH